MSLENLQVTHSSEHRQVCFRNLIACSCPAWTHLDKLLARGCFDPLAPYNSWTWKAFAFWLAISPLTPSNTESKSLYLGFTRLWRSYCCYRWLVWFLPQANSCIKDKILITFSRNSGSFLKGSTPGLSCGSAQVRDRHESKTPRLSNRVWFLEG